METKSIRAFSINTPTLSHMIREKLRPAKRPSIIFFVKIGMMVVAVIAAVERFLPSGNQSTGNALQCF